MEPTQPALTALILQKKGDRSYDRLSEDCGGVPSSGRLHQMATRPLKNFPDPPSIEGLAQGLGVTVTEVVLASARELGLNVWSGIDPDALIIGRAGLLPDSAKQVVTALARDLLRLHGL